MATRTDAYIQATQDLIFKNTTFAGIGDVTGIEGSATPGSLFVALFTDTVEVAYTGYARQPIARSGAGFSRTGNVTTNAADITFVVCPVGCPVQSATHACIYTDVSAGTKLHDMTLVSPIPIQAAVQPIVEAGAITITGS